MRHCVSNGHVGLAGYVLHLDISSGLGASGAGKLIGLQNQTSQDKEEIIRQAHSAAVDG